jgi:hypothetical protein
MKIALPIMVMLFLFACRSEKQTQQIIYKDTTIYLGGYVDTLYIVNPDTSIYQDTSRHTLYSYVSKNDTICIYYAVRDTLIKLDSVIQQKEVIRYVKVKQEVHKCKSLFHKYLVDIFWTIVILLLLYILLRIVK